MSKYNRDYYLKRRGDTIKKEKCRVCGKPKDNLINPYCSPECEAKAFNPSKKLLKKIHKKNVIQLLEEFKKEPTRGEIEAFRTILEIRYKDKYRNYLPIWIAFKELGFDETTAKALADSYILKCKNPTKTDYNSISIFIATHKQLKLVKDYLNKG